MNLISVGSPRPFYTQLGYTQSTPRFSGAVRTSIHKGDSLKIGAFKLHYLGKRNDVPTFAYLKHDEQLHPNTPHFTLSSDFAQINPGPNALIALSSKRNSRTSDTEARIVVQAPDDVIIGNHRFQGKPKLPKPVPEKSNTESSQTSKPCLPPALSLGERLKLIKSAKQTTKVTT